MTLLLGSPVTGRANTRRSRALFSFRAADLQAAFLTGQTPTFVRAGVGGHILDSQGRLCRTPYAAPRFTAYDTDALAGFGQSTALLIEGAIANSCLWSEDLSQATWAKTNVTASAALDIGQLTPGVKPFALMETAINGVHTAQQAITITAGEYALCMAVLKPWPRFKGSLYFENGADRVGADFDLNAVTVANRLAGAGALSGKGILYLSNGYCLVYVAGKVNAASTSVDVVLRLFNDSGTPSYLGSTAQGMIWTHMQFLRCGTTGPTFQSYRGPTTGATASRTRDELYTTAGANAILRQTDFTVYFKLPRPVWADWTGNLNTGKQLLRLGTADPQLSIAFANTSRTIGFYLSDALGNFSFLNLVPIPAGDVLEGVLQVDNWYNGIGRLAYDLGAGLSAYSTPLATRAIGALGSDTIVVGNNDLGATQSLDGGIDELRIITGRLTLAEARSTF